MALINLAHREITAKVVYFGAPGAGSNTNVRTLYEVLPVKEKSRLHHFGPVTSKEESWYFDYVTEAELVSGFAMRLRVYSMPGGIDDAVHRKEVLKGTDSVVFVADARQSRAAANVDALIELERLLKGHGVELATIPLVIQVNHTDADDARDPAAVVVDLNPYGFPVVAAMARSHRGVLEAHDRVATETAARIRENLAGNEASIALTAIHREAIERDDEVIARHVEAISADRGQRGHPQMGLGTADSEVSAYHGLEVGLRLELPFQPREWVGLKPIALLETRFEGDGVAVELVMDRLAGGEPRRLTVFLANRPVDTTPLPRAQPSTGSSPRGSLGGLSTQATLPVLGDTATSKLPDRMDMPKPEPADFPPVWYGVIGIAGGVLLGLLLGFVVFG